MLLVPRGNHLSWGVVWNVTKQHQRTWWVEITRNRRLVEDAGALEGLCWAKFKSQSGLGSLLIQSNVILVSSLTILSIANFIWMLIWLKQVQGSKLTIKCMEPFIILDSWHWMFWCTVCWSTSTLTYAVCEINVLQEWAQRFKGRASCKRFRAHGYGVWEFHERSSWVCVLDYSQNSRRVFLDGMMDMRQEIGCEWMKTFTWWYLVMTIGNLYGFE